jgi:alkylhydroperoxidase family enzyme
VKASRNAKLVESILTDYATAPITERVRATPAFLEKLVLAPATVGREDVERARASGAGREALSEAAYVAFVFGIMDRCADAFGFEPESGKALRSTATLLLRIGYGIASIRG